MAHDFALLLTSFLFKSSIADAFAHVSVVTARKYELTNLERDSLARKSEKLTIRTEQFVSIVPGIKTDNISRFTSFEHPKS